MFLAVQGAIVGIAPSVALATNLAQPTALMKVGGIASQALIYGAIAALCARRWRLLERALPAATLALLLVGWVLCSTLWSVDPLLTARRAPEFALAAMFGLYLTVRYPAERQLRIFWWAMVLLAIGTVMVAYLMPSYGLDLSAGHHADWKGVFTQKNACGRVMVLATAVLLAGRRWGWKEWASGALFVLVLVKSGSRGAWGLEAVLLGGAGMFLVSVRCAGRIRGAVLGLMALVAATAGVLVMVFRDALIAAMGRNTTLSGRAEIWHAVWPFVMQRPWLGWGYEAFWRGWTGPSFQVSAAVHFLVFHAHNGYLDVWLQTGLVGLVLFVAAYGQACLRVWRRVERGQMAELLWPLCLLLIVGLYGLDENTVLVPNGIFWMLFVMATVSLRGAWVRASMPAMPGEAALAYAESAAAAS
ncbi:MAG: O-antigen ligase family protein [Acidobacteriaceae bacterium]